MLRARPRNISKPGITCSNTLFIPMVTSPLISSAWPSTRDTPKPMNRTRTRVIVHFMRRRRSIPDRLIISKFPKSVAIRQPIPLAPVLSDSGNEMSRHTGGPGLHCSPGLAAQKDRYRFPQLEGFHHVLGGDLVFLEMSGLEMRLVGIDIRVHFEDENVSRIVLVGHRI